MQSWIRPSGIMVPQVDRYRRAQSDVLAEGDMAMCGHLDTRRCWSPTRPVAVLAKTAVRVSRAVPGDDWRVG